ncbi:MAG: S8 family serine peptidase [Gammaproteobacteria bacterium]
MKQSLTVVLAAVLAAVCAGAVAAPPADRGAERARVYVAYHADARGPAQRALAAVGAEVHHDLPQLRAFAVSLPAVAVSALVRNPAIEYVEADPKRYPMAETEPYGIAMVQADLVAEGANTANTMVCIIDSGVQLDHEDLSSGQFNGEYDSGSGWWNTDENGHGTHVAGTIAALGGNGTGVVGVAAQGTLPIHIIKVFGADGWTYSSRLTAALQACEDAAVGKKLVINMSLGGSFKSRTEDQAFARAYSRGVLSIAAAGNDGNTRLSYPASYSSVISVAAIDESKTVAVFSQQNSAVELAAPGVGVLSTVPTGTGSIATVTAGGTGYAADGMDGSPEGNVSGAIVDCGIGDKSCPGGGGQVCLIARGTISFADKVLNCQAGGGVAAIIYNNQPGPLYGTLGGVGTSIPSVGISQADGGTIKDLGEVSGNVFIGASNYAKFDGTSMATPHVAGVAAVVWSHGAWTNQQVRDALAATAEDLGAAGRDSAYGYGLVQARAALDTLLAPPPGDGGGGDTGGGPGGGKGGGGKGGKK